MSSFTGFSNSNLSNSNYHPSWESRDFNQDEYEGELETLVNKTPGALLIFDHNSFRTVGLVTYIWQSIMSCFNTNIKTNPIKVKYELFKFLNYGQEQKFLENNRIKKIIKQISDKLVLDKTYTQIANLMAGLTQPPSKSYKAPDVRISTRNYYDKHKSELHDNPLAKLFTINTVLLSQNYAKTQYNLGRIYKDDGDLQRSYQSFSNAVKQSGKDAKTEWKLALGYAAIAYAEERVRDSLDEADQIYAEAINQLKNLISKENESSQFIKILTEAYAFRCTRFIKDNQIDQAISLLSEAASNNCHCQYVVSAGESLQLRLPTLIPNNLQLASFYFKLADQPDAVVDTYLLKSIDYFNRCENQNKLPIPETKQFILAHTRLCSYYLSAPKLEEAQTHLTYAYDRYQELRKSGSNPVPELITKLSQTTKNLIVAHKDQNSHNSHRVFFIAFMQKARELYKEQPNIYAGYCIELANFHLSCKELKTAYDETKKAHILDPTNDNKMLLKERAFALGQEFLQQHLHAEAAKFLREALEYSRDDSNILKLLTETYQTLNEWSNAENLIPRLLKAIPNDINIQMLAANIYIQLGNRADAIRLLEIAKTTYPKHPDPLMLLFKLTGKISGTNADPIEVLELLLTENPTDAKIYAQLGELYQNKQNHEKALENYKEAAKNSVSPKDFDKPIISNYFILADCAQKLLDYQNAIRLLESAKSIFPNNRTILEKLASVYLITGNSDETYRIYENLVLLSQHTNKTDESIGLINLAIQILEDFNKANKLTHQLAEKLITAHTERAIFYIKSNLERSNQHIHNAIDFYIESQQFPTKIAPDIKSKLVKVAEALVVVLQKDNPDHATIITILKALKTLYEDRSKPQYANYCYELSKHYESSNNLKEALAEVKQAFEIHPISKYAEAINKLTSAIIEQGQLGDHQTAIQWLLEAYNRNPQDPKINLEVAKHYLSLHKNKKDIKEDRDLNYLTQAQKHLKLCRKTSTEQESVFAMLARIDFKLKDYHSAIENFLLASQKNTTSTIYANELAESYSAQAHCDFNNGNYRIMLNRFDAALKLPLQPNKAREIAIKLATYCSELTKDDSDIIVKGYQIALIFLSEKNDAKRLIEIYLILAQNCLITNINNAIECLERANKLSQNDKDPNQIQALTLLASCYIKVGKEDKAEKIYSTLVKVDPRNATAHYLSLLEIQIKLKKQKLSVTDCEKAISFYREAYKTASEPQKHEITSDTVALGRQLLTTRPDLALKAYRIALPLLDKLSSTVNPQAIIEAYITVARSVLQSRLQYDFDYSQSPSASTEALEYFQKAKEVFKKHVNKLDEAGSEWNAAWLAELGDEYIKGEDVDSFQEAMWAYKYAVKFHPDNRLYKNKLTGAQKHYDNLLYQYETEEGNKFFKRSMIDENSIANSMEKVRNLLLNKFFKEISDALDDTKLGFFASEDNNRLTSELTKAKQAQTLAQIQPCAKALSELVLKAADGKSTKRKLSKTTADELKAALTDLDTELALIDEYYKLLQNETKLLVEAAATKTKKSFNIFNQINQTDNPGLIAKATLNAIYTASKDTNAPLIITREIRSHIQNLEQLLTPGAWNHQAIIHYTTLYNHFKDAKVLPNAFHLICNNLMEAYINVGAFAKAISIYKQLEPRFTKEELNTPNQAFAEIAKIAMTHQAQGQGLANSEGFRAIMKTVPSFLIKNDYKGALETLRNALKFAMPEQSLSIANQISSIAQTLVNQGKFEIGFDAYAITIDIYSKALPTRTEIASDEISQALIQIGDALTQKRFSIEYATKALGMALLCYETAEPFTDSDYQKMGMVAFQLKQYIPSIQYFQNAVSNNPNNETLHRQLGDAFFANNELLLALDSYKTTERLLSPNDQQLIQEKLLKVYIALGNQDYESGLKALANEELSSVVKQIHSITGALGSFLTNTFYTSIVNGKISRNNCYNDIKKALGALTSRFSLFYTNTDIKALNKTLSNLSQEPSQLLVDGISLINALEKAYDGDKNHMVSSAMPIEISGFNSVLKDQLTLIKKLIAKSAGHQNSNLKQDPKELLHQAIDFYEKARNINEFLNNNEQNNQINAWVQLGEYGTAINLFLSNIQKGSNSLDNIVIDIKAFTELSKLYCDADRFDDAKRVLDDGIDQFPDNPAIKLALSNYYVANGLYNMSRSDYCRAFEFYTLAVQEVPPTKEAPSCYENFGDLYCAAYQNKTTVIRGQPPFSTSIESVSTGVSQPHEYQVQALNYYRQALRADPANAPLNAKFGNLLAELPRPFIVKTAALKNDDSLQNPIGFLRLACALEPQNKNYEKALVVALQKAIEEKWSDKHNRTYTKEDLPK